MHFLTDGKGLKETLFPLRKAEQIRCLAVDEMNDQGIVMNEPLSQRRLRLLEGPFPTTQVTE